MESQGKIKGDMQKKKPNLENSSAELYFASHEAEDSTQRRYGRGGQELAGVFSGVCPVVSAEER